MCLIKKATKLASYALLHDTKADSYTFNPVGQGRELHIGVAHMSHHQLFHLAEAVSLIQLHQRGWQSGLSASIRNPHVGRPSLGISMPNYLLQNTLYLFFHSHLQTHMEVKNLGKCECQKQVEVGAQGVFRPLGV
jgi:hypothetical protein